jgi:hypothetical protein
MTGLCQSFKLDVSSNDTLEIAADFDFRSPVTLYAKTPDGKIVKQTCCSAPLILRLKSPSPTLILEAHYSGRPPGYPEGVKAGPVTMTADVLK